MGTPNLADHYLAYEVFFWIRPLMGSSPEACIAPPITMKSRQRQDTEIKDFCGVRVASILPKSPSTGEKNILDDTLLQAPIPTDK